MVLADRYIYTLMARDMVRGMDEDWLKNLYGMALVPDAVFYLNVAAGGTRAAQLRQVPRAGLLGKRHGPRPVARHVRQFPEIPGADGRAVQAAADAPTAFTIVDGNRSVEDINAELRKKIEAVLAGKPD